MNAVGARQFLHIAVLREQGHGRHRLAQQQAFEKLREGEARALDLGRRRFAAQFRTLDKLLHRGFHATEHVRGRTHADHFQCPDRLVQLLARDPQVAIVDRSHVRATREIRVAHKTAQRSGGGVQRLAQFVQHPGQRAQVVGCEVQIGFVDLHGAPGWN